MGPARVETHTECVLSAAVADVLDRMVMPQSPPMHEIVTAALVREGRVRGRGRALPGLSRPPVDGPTASSPPLGRVNLSNGLIGSYRKAPCSHCAPYGVAEVHTDAGRVRVAMRHQTWRRWLEVSGPIGKGRVLRLSVTHGVGQDAGLRGRVHTICEHGI